MSSPNDVAWRFCLILVLGLAGCWGGSNGRASVWGTVSFDAKPVEDGVIAFVPSGNTKGPSTGGRIQQGKYEISGDKGPLPGSHRVEITATRVTGTTEVKGLGTGPSGPSAAGSVKNIESYIPAQFNTQSTLEFVVRPGSNQQNFDLKSK
ncbi:MAG: hypothetical protein JWN70_4004 [Planctomycetaceae bacterium]|nr:hypothetical protein [Planctomycetaceae bacterium]